MIPLALVTGFLGSGTVLLGLSGVPEAGEIVRVVASEKVAPASPTSRPPVPSATRSRTSELRPAT